MAERIEEFFSSLKGRTEVLLRAVVFISAVLYASGRGTGLAGSLTGDRGRAGRTFVLV